MAKEGKMPNVSTEEIYKVEPEKSAKLKSKTEIVFKSLHRGTIVFVESNVYIKFTNHIYRTNKEKEIEFLREHPAFGSEIFEGEFPDWVLDKFKKDKEYIRHFNIEEEDYLAP